MTCASKSFGGPEGGGTRALALELLKRRGVDGRRRTVRLFAADARESFCPENSTQRFMLLSWESPVVRQLLADAACRTPELSRHGCLCGPLSVFNKVVVPAGVGDLTKHGRPLT